MSAGYVILTHSGEKLSSQRAWGCLPLRGHILDFKMGLIFIVNSIYSNLKSALLERASLIAQLVKNPPAMLETWV